MRKIRKVVEVEEDGVDDVNDYDSDQEKKWEAEIPIMKTKGIAPPLQPLDPLFVTERPSSENGVERRLLSHMNLSLPKKTFLYGRLSTTS